MLECPCEKFYIGKTKRQLKVCIGEHLCAIRNRTREGDKINLMVTHFREVHGGSIKCLSVKSFFALSLSQWGGGL